MRRWTWVRVVSVLVLCVGLTSSGVQGGQRATGDARMQNIMRTKLTNTQTLLRAIVTADFRAIDEAASGLSRISQAEIATWQSPPRREYTEQAMLFLSTVEDLRMASSHRDLAGVGNAYSTLIATCIHCHTYVRDARVAGLSLGTLDQLDWRALGRSAASHGTR